MKTIFRYILAVATVLTIPANLWADATVSTLAELQTAIAGSETTINITADILNVDALMTIDRDVTINGNGHTVSVATPYLTEDGQLATSPTNSGVFSISSSKVVTLQNMTIMGGSTDNKAAVYNNGKLTMQNVNITRSNRGLYNTAVAILKNCYLSRNAAQFGGGLVNVGGQLVMDCCSFSENRSTASGGGAAENKSYGKMYLNNVTMSNNVSAEIGSAINNFLSTTYVMNSTITGNVTMTSLVIKNCGAIGINGGNVYVVNSIVTDNKYITDITDNTLDESDAKANHATTSTYNGTFVNSLLGEDYGGPMTNCKTPSSDGITPGSGVFCSYAGNGVYTLEGSTAGFNHTVLANSGGQFVAPITSTGAAASGGTQTYFDYDAANADPFTVRMSYGAGGTTALGDLSASTTQVTTYQDGSARAVTDPIPIGSSAVSSSTYYTVTRGSFEHGSMSGVSQYGDSYVSGTNVTVTATPDAGYVFTEWKVNGATASTANPYTFALTQNVVINPVFKRSFTATPSDFSVTISSATYTGSPLTPTITIVDNGLPTPKTLVLGTDYEIGAGTYVNAGNYTVTVTGIGDYTGSISNTFTIIPRSINEVTVFASRSYDGSTTASGDVHNYVKLYYPVYDSSDETKNKLAETTDYTYSVSTAYTYKDAGSYADAITLTGTGNFTGSRTLDFFIGNGTDLSGAVVVAEDTYTASALPPSYSNVTVTLGGVELTSDNYSITYVDPVGGFVDAKTYENIIIKGINAYYGEIHATYIIKPRPVPETAITVNELAYNAIAQDPKTAITVKYAANPVIAAANYTVTPAAVTEAGIYTLTIAGVDNSNLIGSKTATLTVTKAFDGTYSADFTTSDISTQIYDGTNAVEPTFSVYDNGRLLEKDVDYTVAYGANNTEGLNAGTMTITGLSPYTGSKTFTFDIVAEYFTVDDITYHTTSSTTVAVGNNGNAATTLTGAVSIPAEVEHVVPTAFQVTGIETGAFKNLTTVTGISMPHATLYLNYIENGAFEGCSALRYIDLCFATSFVPTSLQRNVAASPFYGVPKQALVYLNGTTFTGENYVYKPGDGGDYYCELFKVYDDMNGSQTGFAAPETGYQPGYKWAFENRHNFTAYTVENTRYLTAAQHYTTCLPYDLPVPAGMKVYTLSASSEKLLGFEEVTPAHLGPTETSAWLPKPYVIIPSTSGQLLSTTNAVVHEFKEESVAHESKLNPAVSGSDDKFTMCGTMRYIDGPESATEELYIMQGKDANGICTWKKVPAGAASNTGNNPTGPCVLPMRAYIVSGALMSRERMGSVFTSDINEQTIKDAFDDYFWQRDDVEIFDLQGRKVTDRRNMKRGVYVVNGKKAVR